MDQTVGDIELCCLHIHRGDGSKLFSTWLVVKDYGE